MSATSAFGKTRSSNGKLSESSDTRAKSDSEYVRSVFGSNRPLTIVSVRTTKVGKDDRLEGRAVQCFQPSETNAAFFMRQVTTVPVDLVDGAGGRNPLGCDFVVGSDASCQPEPAGPSENSRQNEEDSSGPEGRVAGRSIR